MTHQVALIPFCPLIGAVLAFLMGRRIPRASGWIATAASGLSFVFVVRIFLSFADASTGGSINEALFPWIEVGSMKVEFALRMDALSMVMCLFVTGTGSLIHLYSVGYMAEDPSRPRFFCYLNLFLFSMLLLVLGANLPVLFIGWEGVGLCSCLLIGFWFENSAFAAAGKKAFIVNRIGDAGFLLGMFLLLREFGTLDFEALSSATAGAGSENPVLLIAALCLFTGAVGKSAQIPLFVWLPDAMAGPTPVSALIHAATMVTAGIYLLARTAFLFDAVPAALFVVALIALLTAFVAATIALVQNDIKKVLAYSTVSQLGFMFLAAGAGAYAAAIFHVVTHAFFKACLFLGAGSAIRGCHHEQDMRQMGGLGVLMPVTAVTYGVATLAIAGIYPFAGYHSKHAIFQAVAISSNPYIFPLREMFLTVAKLTAVLTAFYMARSFVLTFMGKYRGNAHPKESPWTMTVPLAVLAALSAIGGIWVGGNIFEYTDHMFPGAHMDHSEGGISAGLEGSWTALIGLVMGLLFYTKWRHLPGLMFSACGSVSRLFAGRYYLDEIYSALIVRPLELFSGFLFRFVDQTLIDGTVNGTARFAVGGGAVLRYLQSGQVRHYALFILSGTVILLLWSLPW